MSPTDSPESTDAPDAPDTPEPPVEVPSITPADLRRRLAAGDPLRIVDVRDRDAVDAWQIEGPSVDLTQVPLTTFLQTQVTGGIADLVPEADGDDPITAVCAEGEASEYVAGLLVDAGVPAQNLAGGMDAWAELYEATQIADAPRIDQYYRPSSGCLAYVVRSAGEAIVIDPLRAFTDRYADDLAAADATVVAVVDTHLHADHVSGLRTLADRLDADRYVPERTAQRGIDFAAETLADGDSLSVGDATVRAVALPGHTTDMTGFAVGDCLLTGDSLFLDGVARPDLQVDEGADPESLARTLYETLTEGIADLGDDTIVAPGHVSEAASPSTNGGFVATLGEVRERLAVFTEDEDTFVERVGVDLPPPPANADRIVQVNRGAIELSEDAAFTVELGPNRCGVGALADT